jgi:pyridoxal 5'-phosphate synthase pdxS subunit
MNPSKNESTPLVKRGLAEMLKGGVIMDVVNVEQAKIAEDSGAVAVMALERVPADIRAQGATNLGEALRRITEGAAMIRSKGEAGTGDVSEATKHIRTILGEINALSAKSEDELYVAAKELQAPYDLVREVARTKKLPVVLFVAGGVATPADAAMMMQLGADGVFVGSGIFKSGDPVKRAAAIVKAVAAYNDASVVADSSRGLGEAMVGINVKDLPAPHRLSERGW